MEVANGLKHIEKSFSENKLSHAFLIETNNFEKCLKDLKKIIKIMNCENKFKEDCQECNLCYQIDKETLPSLVIVRPDGATLKKDQILELKEKMLTRPVYSIYNTYIIMESEKLNTSSANTMLKSIEEPEDNIIGFFLTSNKENIIETIRSRCQIIFQYYDEEEIKLDDEKLATVEDYIKNLELDNKHALLYNKNIFLEKEYTREDIVKIFLEIFKIYDNIYRNDLETEDKYPFLTKITKEKLTKKLVIINKTIENLNKNGNINLILDSFVIEMR